MSNRLHFHKQSHPIASNFQGSDDAVLGKSGEECAGLHDPSPVSLCHCFLLGISCIMS